MNVESRVGNQNLPGGLRIGDADREAPLLPVVLDPAGEAGVVFRVEEDIGALLLGGVTEGG